MEMIENEFGEDWVKIEEEDDDVIRQFNHCLNGIDNLSTSYIAGVPNPDVIGNPHYVWGIHGGKNGGGNWIIYMLDLITILVKLNEIFNKVSVLSIRTDIPDDVFDVRIVCGDRKID